MFNIKKGFTLIELLVVIAIIAILAAILFPVFAQAREKARQASCLSNCKQIGTAIQLYVDDYDETLPFYMNTAIPRNATNKNLYPGYPVADDNFVVYAWLYNHPQCWNWMDSIFPYTKSKNIFVCPSGQKNVPGYGINLRLVTSDSGNTMDAALGTAKVVCLSEVKSPSDLVFLTDNAQASKAGYGVQCPIIQREQITSSCAVQPNRHINGACWTFCDGHAKYYKKGSEINPYLFSLAGFGNGLKHWDPAY